MEMYIIEALTYQGDFDIVEVDNRHFARQIAKGLIAVRDERDENAICRIRIFEKVISDRIWVATWDSNGWTAAA